MFPAFWSQQSPSCLGPRPLISQLQLTCTPHKTSALQFAKTGEEVGRRHVPPVYRASRTYVTWAQCTLPATHTRLPCPERFTFWCVVSTVQGPRKKTLSFRGAAPRNLLLLPPLAPLTLSIIGHLSLCYAFMPQMRRDFVLPPDICLPGQPQLDLGYFHEQNPHHGKRPVRPRCCDYVASDLISSGCQFPHL